MSGISRTDILQLKVCEPDLKLGDMGDGICPLRNSLNSMGTHDKERDRGKAPEKAIQHLACFTVHIVIIDHGRVWLAYMDQKFDADRAGMDEAEPLFHREESGLSGSAEILAPDEKKATGRHFSDLSPDIIPPQEGGTAEPASTANEEGHFAGRTGSQGNNPLWVNL